MDDLAIANDLREIATRLIDLAARVEANSEERRHSPTTPSGGRLLTASEVAERTALPLWRVYELGRRGDAGAVRVGDRGVRFSESGLQHWIRGGGVRS